MTRPSDTEAAGITEAEWELAWSMFDANGAEGLERIINEALTARLSASTDQAERAEAQRDGTLAAYREQRDHLNRVMAERDALAAKLEAVERLAKWELGQPSTVLKSEIRDALAVQSVQETPDV